MLIRGLFFHQKWPKIKTSFHMGEGRFVGILRIEKPSVNQAIVYIQRVFNLKLILVGIAELS